MKTINSFNYSNSNSFNNISIMNAPHHIDPFKQDDDNDMTRISPVHEPDKNDPGRTDPDRPTIPTPEQPEKQENPLTYI